MTKAAEKFLATVPNEVRAMLATACTIAANYESGASLPTAGHMQQLHERFKTYREWRDGGER